MILRMGRLVLLGMLCTCAVVYGQDDGSVDSPYIEVEEMIEQCKEAVESGDPDILDMLSGKTCEELFGALGFGGFE